MADIAPRAGLPDGRQPPQQRPSVGRVVLYVPAPGQAGGATDTCPAIITRVWSDTVVNLSVFPDMGAGFSVASVDLLPTVPPVLEPRTCFWPPRV